MYKGRHMLIRKKINDTSLPGFEARKPENLLHEVIVYTLYIQVPFSPKLRNQILLIYHPLNYNARKCAFSSITSIQTKHHKIQLQFSRSQIFHSYFGNHQIGFSLLQIGKILMFWVILITQLICRHITPSTKKKSRIDFNALFPVITN